MSTDVVAASDLQVYALYLGDDCLILSHRLAELAAHAPEFEEDVALSNLALDLLGQARALLTYAGVVEAAGRDEDALAYGRDDREFHNLLLVEQPNFDFAHTIVRQLFFASYQLALYRRLEHSQDLTLAAVAAKGAKEASYHRDHARLWTVRLGDGTKESHSRMEAAVGFLWPFTGELFQPDPITQRLVAAGIAADPAALEPVWRAQIDQTFAEAGLGHPVELGIRQGGRSGLHSEHLGHLLSEMQHLHRSHPNASW
ncbi:MAG: phenylacetate-CoA oxygenase subunit PaaC [Candidatus Dormibacteraeota bacterium]|nr:phenylacetate-CoA oxygenase subunit PaaC [Candidatus Dormibacteraeota bacterium]